MWNTSTLLISAIRLERLTKSGGVNPIDLFKCSMAICLANGHSNVWHEDFVSTLNLVVSCSHNSQNVTELCTHVFPPKCKTVKRGHENSPDLNARTELSLKLLTEQKVPYDIKDNLSLCSWYLPCKLFTRFVYLWTTCTRLGFWHVWLLRILTWPLENHVWL